MIRRYYSSHVKIRKKYSGFVAGSDIMLGVNQLKYILKQKLTILK